MSGSIPRRPLRNWCGGTSTWFIPRRLRHAGSATQAEEITQAVFIIFARKAAGLRAETNLDGWLYETTRLTSLSLRRSERRRQFREQEAYMQSMLEKSAVDPVWPQLSPLLDEMPWRGSGKRNARW